MERLRVRVSGRVQGVFFRASAEAEAARLGLTGWVMNDHDGSVLLEAQGARPALDELLQWCHRGPRSARVEEVDHEWLLHLEDEVTFRVRH